jgi:hypothetical protein
MSQNHRALEHKLSSQCIGYSFAIARKHKASFLYQPMRNDNGNLHPSMEAMIIDGAKALH